jgi:hypothetical protein
MPVYQVITVLSLDSAPLKLAKEITEVGACLIEVYKGSPKCPIDVWAIWLEVSLPTPISEMNNLLRQCISSQSINPDEQWFLEGTEI